MAKCQWKFSQQKQRGGRDKITIQGKTIASGAGDLPLSLVQGGSGVTVSGPQVQPPGELGSEISNRVVLQFSPGTGIGKMLLKKTRGFTNTQLRKNIKHVLR